MEPRLPHAGIKPEIADQLGGSPETPDIADGRDEVDRDRDVDARDRHQAADVHWVERDRRQPLIGGRGFLCDEVQARSVAASAA